MPSNRRAASQYVIPTTSIENFMGQYVSLGALCKKHNKHIRYIDMVLRSMNVTPIELPKAASRIYRKSER